VASTDRAPASPPPGGGRGVPPAGAKLLIRSQHCRWRVASNETSRREAVVSVPTATARSPIFDMNRTAADRIGVAVARRSVSSSRWPLVARPCESERIAARRVSALASPPKVVRPQLRRADGSVSVTVASHDAAAIGCRAIHCQKYRANGPSPWEPLTRPLAPCSSRLTPRARTVLPDRIRSFAPAGEHAPPPGRRRR